MMLMRRMRFKCILINLVPQGCPGTFFECNEGFLFNEMGSCVNGTQAPALLNEIKQARTLAASLDDIPSGEKNSLMILLITLLQSQAKSLLLFVRLGGPPQMLSSAGAPRRLWSRVWMETQREAVCPQESEFYHNILKILDSEY